MFEHIWDGQRKKGCRTRGWTVTSVEGSLVFPFGKGVDKSSFPTNEPERTDTNVDHLSQESILQCIFDSSAGDQSPSHQENRAGVGGL
jgi:hypothetical protein